MAGRMITLVLGGGRSSRFGSSKLDVRLDGLPMLAWLQRRLEGLEADAWWLNLAPEQALPIGVRVLESDEESGCEPGAGSGGGAGVAVFERVVRDAQPGMGPLAGMAAAFEAADPDDIIVVLAGDMPAVTTAYIETLENSLSLSDRQAGVVAKWAIGAQAGRLEPLPSIWRAGPASALAIAALAQGKGGPSELAEDPSVGRVLLHFEESAEEFMNVNTPTDLAIVGKALGVTVTAGA